MPEFLAKVSNQCPPTLYQSVHNFYLLHFRIRFNQQLKLTKQKLFKRYANSFSLCRVLYGGGVCQLNTYILGIGLEGETQGSPL